MDVDSVKVGYADYTVEKWPGQDASDNESHGIVYHDKHRIRIVEGLDEPYMAEVLIHELGHCVCNVFQLHLPSEIEERLVGAFSHGIAMIVRDNPGLVVELMVALGCDDE